MFSRQCQCCNLPHAGGKLQRALGSVASRLWSQLCQPSMEMSESQLRHTYLGSLPAHSQCAHCLHGMHCTHSCLYFFIHIKQNVSSSFSEELLFVTFCSVLLLPLFLFSRKNSLSDLLVCQIILVLYCSFLWCISK